MSGQPTAEHLHTPEKEEASSLGASSGALTPGEGQEHGSSKGKEQGATVDVQQVPIKRGLKGVGLVFACGTALFSDGYQNAIVGSVNTILTNLYPREVGAQNYGTAFSSAGFAGTVLGMLVFGYLADRVGRKFGMIACTLIVAVFTALCAGAYGAGGSITGMLIMLTTMRVMVGVGVGGEYPAGSVAASENTEDPAIKKGIQHGIFVAATNCSIDAGFVIAAFVPLVLVWIFGQDHLRAIWRICFGLGVIPPLLVLFWRLRMQEPESYRKHAMRHVRTPYLLIIRRYWVRFTAISLAWFLYDFITYPFGIYSSIIVDTIIGAGSKDYVKIFGWNTVINCFYLPGCFLGALLVDRVGPKRLMVIALVCQSAVGFGMSGGYNTLKNNIGGFAVIYGFFLSLGELGPGSCLGLLASKASPTAFRGKFYGGAAAIGKIGAFAGTWAFPAIKNHYTGQGNLEVTVNVYVGAGLALLSAAVTLFFVPEIPQDFMSSADADFRAYLERNGFDVSKMGLQDEGDLEQIIAPEPVISEKEKHAD